MTRLSLTLLGDFQARLGPGPPLRLRARKTQALLAYLALPAGQAHSRDKLAALLWGDGSAHDARSRLRETLFVLRRSLAPADPVCLNVGNETVALNAEAVDVDAMAFKRLVERGGAEALGAAADLYRGNLLEGLDFRGALFEEWLMTERERLRELALDALAKLLAHQWSAGLTESALQTALRLIALDPLQEPVHRTLMRLYIQLGRRGSALRQYQICVNVLRRELGVEPEADTRKVYQEVLRHRGGMGIPDGRRSPDGGSPPGVPVTQRLTVPTGIPLIGRAGEIARGRAALVDARAGRGGVMLVVGEAGVGKTSLIGALATDACSAGARVLLGRSFESTQILPFGPWVDACRAGGVLDDEALKRLDPVWRTELTRLFPEMDHTGLPPPSDNDLHLFESVARLVEHLAARQLIVLMLEDVHWADEMSLRLLAFLALRIPRWRLWLVATSRDDELADAAAARRTLGELGGHPWVTQVTLAPLSHADTMDLVRFLARAGSDAGGLAEVEEQVWAISEGNPFVVVETMRAGQHGTFSPESTGLPLPERVRAMIAARLDRLSEPARQLAAMAAVIGREFEFPLLHHASGLDEASAAEGVEELVRRRVLQSIGNRFDFVHHRLQTVVYDRILPHRRKLLHRSAGEALEGLSPEDLERDPLALGLHFREGEVWDKALRYLRQAGIQSGARSANREAIACFEQALEIVPHLPDRPTRLEQATDLLLELRISLWALGELARGAECASEAARLAGELGDQRRLATASVCICHDSRMAGRFSEAVVFGQRALTAADKLEDSRLTISATYSLGLAHSYLGHYAEAEELLRRAIDTVRGDWVRDRCALDGFPAVLARAHLARVLGELGRFEDAVALGQDAIGVAEALDHPYSLAMASWCIGWLYNLRGKFHRAITLLERAREISVQWEVAILLQTILEQLGFSYACSGRIDEGVDLLEESFRRYGTAGRRPLTVNLGEVYAIAGRLAAATAYARQALTIAKDSGEQRLEAYALRLLGEILLQCDPMDSREAEECYEEGLSLAEALGLRPLMAHCHLGLAKLYRRTGKQQDAHDHLATATTMYREMDMPFYLEQAEAEMREA